MSWVHQVEEDPGGIGRTDKGEGGTETEEVEMERAVMQSERRTVSDTELRENVEA